MTTTGLGPTLPAIRLTDLTDCGGCAAKLARNALASTPPIIWAST